VAENYIKKGGEKKSTEKISIQPESRNFFFLLVLLLQVKKKHGQDTSMHSFVP
jgi:hypothetical protein